jgi:phage baseplate assembly protein W
MVDEWNQWDLMLTPRQAGRLIGDRETVDFDIDRQDLAIGQGHANLTQALLNRLHTRRGELAQLGHPEYGSRLYQLIGELNNTRTRLLAELYIRECLAQESRISDRIEIVFDPASRSSDRNALNGVVTVNPIGNLPPFSFNLFLDLRG